MSGYLKYFKTELLMGLQYRVAAISGLCTQFFWGILYCLLYEAFYSQASIDAMSFREMISYVWLMQAFLSLIYLRVNDTNILENIKNGTVAYELCRPYNIYYWWFVKLLSTKYAAVALRCLPVILLGFLLPAPYNLGLPISLEAFVLFIISLILGSLVVVGISMIIHTISFFTLESKGMTSIVCSLGEILSGFAIPVPLLPTAIVNATKYLPFRLIGDTPFRIYSGNINVIEAKNLILLQIIWIILLIIIGNLLIKKALKKVCIQGG